MYQIILFFHVFASIFIIVLVLLQQGRGATVGASFGSGASQTVFGSRGSGSFLFRLTLGLLGLFFTTSIVMNYMAAHAYKQAAVINLPTQAASAPATVPASKTAPVQNAKQPVTNTTAPAKNTQKPVANTTAPAIKEQQPAKAATNAPAITTPKKQTTQSSQGN